jgi:hypothetical protein
MKPVFLLLLVSIQVFAQPETELRVNLGGYHPEMPKKALILSRVELDNPTVVLKSTDNETTQSFSAAISPAKAWKPFPFTYEVDFSEVSQLGTYQFSLGNVESEEFHIAAYPFWQEDVVDFIRSQRCGFNPFVNAPCHTEDGLSFFGTRSDSSFVDVSGGWHDAGDQLKYLITSSNTTARLLMAYEQNSVTFNDQFDSKGLAGKNGLADVLDEAKWGLDWILKMHPSTNELYHQVADDRDHRGFKLPHQDNADYGWGKNSSRPAYFATGEPQGLSKYKSKATGIANLAGRSAATLALGYRIFSKIKPYKTFAEKCLQASKELYAMGQQQEGYQQGNSFGAPYRYEENTWADDMEWAAAVLYSITQEPKLLKDARRYAKLINTWSWMERDTASHYEMYPYVNMGHYELWKVGKEKDKKRAIAYYKHNLNQIQKRADENPYGVGHLFIWCSNNLAAAVATQAMLYEEMKDSEEFKPLMQNHVNWLLGLNPWNSSMITEIPEGKDSPLDVHMPFWKLLNKPVKGSLVDGPLWSTIHDKMLAIELSEPDEYAHLQPEQIKYWDDYMDYSTNEPTLDGSAELLLILTFLSSE